MCKMFLHCYRQLIWSLTKLPVMDQKKASEDHKQGARHSVNMTCISAIDDLKLYVLVGAKASSSELAGSSMISFWSNSGTG